MRTEKPTGCFTWAGVLPTVWARKSTAWLIREYSIGGEGRFGSWGRIRRIKLLFDGGACAEPFFFHLFRSKLVGTRFGDHKKIQSWGATGSSEHISTEALYAIAGDGRWEGFLRGDDP